MSGAGNTVDRRQLIENLRLPLDRLPDPLPIPVLESPFDAAVTPPGSKSMTNRALLLAALAEGTSTLKGALVDAEDAQVMLRAVQQLGAGVKIDGSTVHVTGVAGRWKPRERDPVLNLQNAGTATRFLAAAAILSDPAMGPVTIDGTPRMRERPIGELVEALRALGGRVEYAGNQGFPPVRVFPPADLAALGAEVHLGPTQSSQFISALLLVAPFLPRGIFAHLEEPITSVLYVEMTCKVMMDALIRHSVQVRRPGTRSIRVPGLGERLAPPTPPNSPAYLAPHPVLPLAPFEITIPPDDSALAFFLAAATIVPGARLHPPTARRMLTVYTITTLSHAGPIAGERLTPDERTYLVQDGDPTVRYALHRCGLRERLGPQNESIIVGPKSVTSLEANLRLIPDETMAVAVVCCFAKRPSTLRGLKTLRIKETDRVAALQMELGRIGVTVEPFTYEDEIGTQDLGINITPPKGGLDCSPDATRVEFDTYDDHRMAMSLALIGLRRPNVFIKNPACVAKTYPTFWSDLAKLYEQSRG